MKRFHPLRLIRQQQAQARRRGQELQAEAAKWVETPEGKEWTAIFQDQE